MYSHDRVVTMEYRSVWPSTGRVVCPHFEWQLGLPQDSFISVHLPRTNPDKQELIRARRTATLNGGTPSVVHEYLLGVSDMIEG